MQNQHYFIHFTKTNKRPLPKFKLKANSYKLYILLENAEVLSAPHLSALYGPIPLPGGASPVI